VGDRVTLEPGVPDLVCEQCRAGRYNLCPNVRFFATPPIDGAFARFVTIHEAFAYALPEELTLEQGALMEPLSVGVWACRKGGVGPGSRVLVSGAGPIGNLAAQVALAAGAAEVVVTDISPHRLDVAARVGATRVLDVSSTSLAESGMEADVLLECSGVPVALVDGIRALAPAGTAVVVGMGPEEDATIPLSLIQNRELWLTGTFRYANTYPTAIALAAQGRVDLDIIMTGRYGLDDAEAALRAPRRIRPPSSRWCSRASEPGAAAGLRAVSSRPGCAGAGRCGPARPARSAPGAPRPVSSSAASAGSRADRAGSARRPGDPRRPGALPGPAGTAAAAGGAAATASTSTRGSFEATRHAPADGQDDDGDVVAQDDEAAGPLLHPQAARVDARQVGQRPEAREGPQALQRLTVGRGSASSPRAVMRSPVASVVNVVVPVRRSMTSACTSTSA
jgi:L-iditol 2-dehydrogenase